MFFVDEEDTASSFRGVREVIEARGRSERAFGTHQELALAGITSMEAANRYLSEVYLPAFNAELGKEASSVGSTFVPWIGGRLDDILCDQFERTVGADNCLRFEGLSLQIPADKHRCHYVKARVRVHRYANGNLAVFHGHAGCPTIITRERRLPRV